MNETGKSQDIGAVAVPMESPVNAAHTPGPWSVSGKLTIRAGRTASAVIAKTNWRNGESNALLIAAAPDLLNALKHCVIQRDEWLEEARAAIAKAEGRSR